MPRTIFLSPDPRPNHPFTVTFAIEGLDASGKPLAVVGDEYCVTCATSGVILFDAHLVKIAHVDEKSNHRAEIAFVSRDGFQDGGKTFSLAVTHSEDPTIREERDVSVAAPLAATAATPVLPIPPVALPAPAAPLALPAIATGPGTPRPGVPLIGGPAPAAALAAPTVTPTAATPLAPATPPAPIPPPFRNTIHPLVYALGIGIVFAIVLVGVQYNAEPSKAVENQAPQATSVPATSDTPDAGNQPDTHEPADARVNSLKTSIPPKAPTAPQEQPQSKPCGACP
ncbi:hypothetical protein A3C09_00100 [Candidatus Uhrbacteria bacterium RIFCSPHIGHO2_02_FULL_47_44]|nr:MAG: hypothetical protein A2839_01775 [Candidatus Uhrbacteria bacterium RIFCSPHIGHO2_01_FULL_47_10]OGL71618.1 MAG: hypothetical protein A3C09_00100 [Candidatus Uhrbacteria bacterium RIFCSPHIGHO2_02_FULL_47_44]